MSNRKKLIIIAHAPSDNTRKMAEAVVKGATNPEITGVEVQCKAPLETQPDDIISAHALIIGTTENLGYMAGLVKDVFDRCYYPCLDKTQGLPFAFYVRAGHDGTGTQRAIESVATGLRWRIVQEPLICRGDFQQTFISQCEDLGLSMAASLDAGII
ncbi:MAG: flavodoxin family protein [Gammaproteobacteria bacterium]|uniref:flavodoxin family protein n=1 Tax=Pseudomaricurvus alcaniphilus TaxID=1166482 RepID=UPI001409B4E2|nr:flavodoxin family protein [Pseudomaricurvus alcaniphilus]MBR9911499.1 flavodoxin family protein [Gammaproteobacteria bacterium]NHN35936.1 flavodoxin family protein [Pseudomaricurvus alcaniphilus]